MTNYIREMSGKQYLKRLAENPTVIIPTGACEIYGPQLPMGSDLIAAKRIAELVAEKTGALIAPTIEAGESSALASFPCTFAMPRKILEDWLDFLVGKLIKDGAKNFVFITGHAGNVDTVNYIGKKYLNEHDIRLVQIDWWRFTNANGSDIFQYSGQMAHGHASECGTSVMLYLYPELVDMDDLSRVEPIPAGGFSGFHWLWPVYGQDAQRDHRRRNGSYQGKRGKDRDPVCGPDRGVYGAELPLKKRGGWMI